MEKKVLEKKNKRLLLPALLIAFLLVFSSFALARLNTETGLRVQSRAAVEANVLNSTAAVNSNSVLNEADDDNDAADDGVDSGAGIGARIRAEIEGAKEKFEQNRERYLEIRANYVEAKSRVAASIQSFNAVRARIRSAAPEDRNQLAVQLRVHARETLLNQVNAILNHLEAIKDKEVAPDNIDELTEFFSEVEASLENEEITQEELIEISSDIRVFWREHRLGLKKGVGLAINARIQAHFQKAETFSERLSEIIDRLEAEGKDVSLLERGLAKLDSDIEKFRSAYARLREQYSEADSRQEFNDVLTKGHRLLKAMNEQLKKDFRLMNALFKATRELIVSEEISGSTSADIEAGVESSETEIEFDAALAEFVEVTADE
ncbi:MAG: hypothetical protein QT03_C0001G0163 [archaeon GW2011_AR10]|uniref:Uncharacterized protein n=1 Tax=Candidatus Iainarchaeum sp. TaxID=3101447 RepID=A0A7J4IUH6_9ARCH|nr:MAG: hypothetical protein QT03_C0001G0163 [archaeon GW2011_AR10]HIH08490.1 hypothetical protein [Candidatus Diapherotrites archaeon]